MNRVFAVFLATLMFAVGSLYAGDESKDSGESKNRKSLEERIAELEAKLGGYDQGDQEEGKDKWVYQTGKEGRSPQYSKPFVTRFGRTTYLGGYIDLEYIDRQGADSTFDNHRLIPFIFSDISDSVKFAAEIEYEHTGEEVEVEFAFLDFLLVQPEKRAAGSEFTLNLRAGAILDPLGKLNLYHDSPILDTTDRPLVDKVIIPTTLREPGLGFWGKYDPGSFKIDYELYLVNGFKGLDDSGSTVLFNKKDGLRKGRPSSDDIGKGFRDHNGNKAVVGRVGLLPFIGLDLGFSWHYGTYDERDDNTLAIYAFDWDSQLGGLASQLGFGSGAQQFLNKFVFSGEYAYADIERDFFAKDAGGLGAKKTAVPGDMSGYYAQLKYLFMPQFLRDLMGPIAEDESTYSLVYQFNRVDLDGNGTKRHVFAVNYRVDKYSVIKLDYQINDEFKSLKDSKNNAWLLSFASYF